MVKGARTVELEPIDRLEEKVRLLVAHLERLKEDAARLANDNARLSQELEAAQMRLTDAETTTDEISTLREERELVRSRVAGMLEQLEALPL
jgi:regulator of replication initiation timing